MSKKNVIDTGRFKIGQEYPTYFIADIAANHDGDLSRAKDLIYLCADAGANAAKFQNFFAETIVSDHGFRCLGDQMAHQKKWKKSVFEVYQDASLPIEWAEELRATCDQAGIDYFTSPYDLEMIEYLSRFVVAWKLGSGDITWHDSIALMAADRKPLFIATGASDLCDVKAAMDVALRHTDDVCLMQCNTNYTGSIENFRHIALNVLSLYRDLYPNTVLGLSDHTPGLSTTLGAVALGACAVEKHFTDDTKREGPDHPFSVDTKSWAEMVERTRELEYALGARDKRVMENEIDTVVLQRRALRVKGHIAAGQKLTRENLTILRPCPAGGLPPFRLANVVGKKSKTNLSDGHLLAEEDLE